MNKKLVIIGGVAGGATAAARARRLDESAEIVLFERGRYISFANCGLPYYIGKDIEKRSDLLITTPKAFRDRYRIDVRTNTEVIEINKENKTVTARDIKSGATCQESYDRLILSPGAEPLRPPIPGINLDNIFTLRTIPDADSIKKLFKNKKPDSAVVVGGGFIGIEMAENLAQEGITTHIVEMLDQVMAPLDPEMAAMIHLHLREKGVHLVLGDGVKSFDQAGEQIQVTTVSGHTILCDLVIMSIGIKPESKLAADAGLETNNKGGIKVTSTMQTSDPDIYAVGDAVETYNFISGTRVMVPLAGPANKQARIAADNAMGRKSVFRGTTGTAIVKIFDLAAAVTGMNEKSLKQNNTPYLVSYTHSNSHASYYPGYAGVSVKLIFTPGSGTILGAQIIGGDGVDKRIDVIATAIRGRMTVFDLEELELAYAPPFSSAKDPVNMAGFVASNILKGDVETILWYDISDLNKNEYILLDLRDKDELEASGTIEGAIHIPVNTLREKLSELDKSKTHITFCAVGLRAYIGYRILVQNGFKALNLSGGYETFLPTMR